MTRACSGCGCHFCDGRCYDASPEPSDWCRECTRDAEVNADLRCVECAADAKVEQELLATLETQKRRAA